MTDVTSPAELDALRDAIDELDLQILELVARRVSTVLQVADYKRVHGMPVYDPERERRLLERLCELRPAPLDTDTVRRVFERLIDESRRVEQKHLERQSG